MEGSRIPLVGIRVDSSTEIGHGHVARCLTLANSLRSKGAEVCFISRQLTKSCDNKIREFRFARYFLHDGDLYAKGMEGNKFCQESSECDQYRDAVQTNKILDVKMFSAVIVDHYDLDAHWEKEIYRSGIKIIAIDDLANRTHFCDLLVDQNLGNIKEDYEALMLKEDVKYCIGPNFAILRSEFIKTHNHADSFNINSALKKIVISFGGVDKDNVTKKVLTLLENKFVERDFSIDIVIGGSYPWERQLKEFVKYSKLDIKIIQNAQNMAELYMNSDLAIGAAGISAWERCAIGIPTILIPVADNQISNASILNRVGAAIQVKLDDCFNENLYRAILRLEHHDNRKQTSLASRLITDGDGATRLTTVIGEMLDDKHNQTKENS